MYTTRAVGGGALGVLALTGLGPLNALILALAVAAVVGGLLMIRTARRRRIQ